MTQSALTNDAFRFHENEDFEEKSYSKNEEEIQRTHEKEDGPKKVSDFRTAAPQFLASSAKNLVLLDLGMTIGYSTIVIPELLNATDGLTFTEEQASWFGSIIFICQPVGSVISGFLFEPIGRKKALILVNFPHILGWLLTYFATSLTQLFVAAIIMGVGIGFMEAPLITYVGEIAQAKWRGTLIAYAEVFVTVGFTVIYFIGTMTDWRTAAAISTVVPMMAALAITQVPESPVWLISKGRLKDAERSLCWLRGWVEPELVRQEFQDLVRHNKKSYESKKQDIKISVISDNGTSRTILEGSVETKGLDCSGKIKSVIGFLGLKDLFRRQTMQPLLLVLVFFIFHHLGGVSGTRPYMVPIFQDFGSPIDPNWATVIDSIVGIVSNILSFLMISRIGKRMLSHISFIGCAITNLIISIYGFFFIGSSAAWIPVTSYFALNFLWTFGIGQTPWLLVSEIFPFRGRGLASGVSAAVAYLIGFLVTKTYFNLRDGLTVSGAFAFYGIAMIIGSILFYYYVPETEGKSLEEVEAIFEKKFNPNRNLSRRKSENDQTITLDSYKF